MHHTHKKLPQIEAVFLWQHHTMGAAGFGGSFAPIVQYEKWEIHKVFPHFPYFRLGQNFSPNLLAPLCGVALFLRKAEHNGQIAVFEFGFDGAPHPFGQGSGNGKSQACRIPAGFHRIESVKQSADCNSI